MTSLNNPELQTAASTARHVAIIGGGPAGLMAAEVLAAGGVQVDVYDAMPSVGRKFLLAGKGGMNLTHSEPYPAFLSRYGARRPQIAPMLDQFGPDALRAWVQELGIDTFVGSSGRVFPTDMKAAPLLRAWLHRLRQAGVRFHMRHRWLGWDQHDALRFETPLGEQSVKADAIVLALGGGSWARLGSDAKWVPLLEQRAVQIAPLLPSNCGFDVGWSEYFRSRFAGQHLKSVAILSGDADGEQPPPRKQGEFVVTADGIEGSLVYALSAGLRDSIAAGNAGTTIHIDLLPDWPLQRVIDEVARPRGARSWSSHLQSRLGLKGVKTGLLRELVPPADFIEPLRLAHAIKALPLTLLAPRPIDEAISSAGGVAFDGMDQQLMLKALPGVFCAGEMLDWEAPTGGYLLTACLASGRVAGHGVLNWLP
ncbi:TIGR03862 family flavoprotein [Collimonas pratensis]|uniref:Flavo, HI0933 family protein n=1 Tax=Collimonas pratensis TaxID=279113 RepID=A0A127Q375_9BURK|nr:TIGR03862 family flavoprotein [Collimonas pratensis]AMP04540.1 flavo, HI0933 family protein [Collimonas pratensis]